MSRRAILLAVAVVADVGVAHAAPPARRGARLTWVRGIEAERCVGSLGLQEDVKSRLGWDPWVLPQELAIEGTIVRSAAGFRAELVVRDASGHVLGTRRFASNEADCRSLGEAAAVAITVAIDPDAIGARSPIVEEAPPPNETPAKAPPPPAALPAHTPHGHALALVGASVGLVPGITPSASLRARVAIGASLEIGLGANVWPETRSSGVGFGLTTVAIDACVTPIAALRALGWCAAAHSGLFSVFVHAPELAPVEVGMFPWLGAETGPALSVPLGSLLRLEANVSAIVPILRRQAFVRGRPDPVWEQAPVGGRAELGVGASF